jgi:hypothetical protein
MKDLIPIRWKEIKIGQKFIIQYGNSGESVCRKISKHYYKYVGKRETIKVSKDNKKHIYLLKE